MLIRFERNIKIITVGEDGKFVIKLEGEPMSSNEELLVITEEELQEIIRKRNKSE